MHPLGSPFVRDQLSIRTVTMNDKPLLAARAYVLYWMQSCQRLEDNWALRLATLESDRVNKPLLIHHGIDASDTYASARFLTFMLEGAQEMATRASVLGLTYRCSVSHGAAEDRQLLDRLARNAALVVTDQFPSDGVNERTAAAARRIDSRLLAVDSYGVVPSACFDREEYSARTIRPKYRKLLDVAAEAVQDRSPKRALPDALLASFPFARTNVLACDVAAVASSWPVDQKVRPVGTRGGLVAARTRLHAFVADGLHDYSNRRLHPSDESGTSRLSPYLRYGMISPLEVVAAVRVSAPPAAGNAYLDEALTWRELALNFCLRNPGHASLDALPAWARRTIIAHASDRREVTYSLAELESATTHDEVWNAGQRELVETGVMHPVMRMLWGKAVASWAPTCEEALAWMLHLNNKYALDGRDPASYAGAQWCLGKFDRPFAERRVLGVIRTMSLERARAKHDLGRYLARWQPERMVA